MLLRLPVQFGFIFLPVDALNIFWNQEADTA